MVRGARPASIVGAVELSHARTSGSRGSREQEHSGTSIWRLRAPPAAAHGRPGLGEPRRRAAQRCSAVQCSAVQVSCRWTEVEIGRQRTRFLATSPRHADAARMAKIHIVHIVGVVFGVKRLTTGCPDAAEKAAVGKGGAVAKIG